MIGRPFRVDWHPEDTEEALKAAYRAEQDTMLRTRLHGLWLLGEVVSGWGPLSDGADMGVVVQEGRGGGGASHSMKGKGQPGFLSEEQERELSLVDGSGQLREWIDWSELQTGKRYIWEAGMFSEGAARSSRKGGRRCTGVVEKGGLCEALGSAGVKAETVLGFADEMRVGLRGMVGTWGVKVRQRVQTVRRRGKAGFDSMKSGSRGAQPTANGWQKRRQDCLNSSPNWSRRVFEEVAG